MKKIKIGLFGLGTVGSGVFKTLKNFPEAEIEKIVVRNINKSRNIDDFDSSILTQNADEILDNPEIEIVVLPFEFVSSSAPLLPHPVKIAPVIAINNAPAIVLIFLLFI